MASPMFIMGVVATQDTEAFVCVKIKTAESSASIYKKTCIVKAN